MKFFVEHVDVGAATIEDKLGGLTGASLHPSLRGVPRKNPVRGWCLLRRCGVIGKSRRPPRWVSTSPKPSTRFESWVRTGENGNQSTLSEDQKVSSRPWAVLRLSPKQSFGNF